MTENKSTEAFVEKKDGKLVAIASNEEKDRMGDVIVASGWDLGNFKKNPVLQFAHDYSIPPIGIAKNIKVVGKKLLFEPVFHEITQLARDIKQMFEADPPIMRAFSVGFIPLEFDSKDPQKIVKQELLEISAVPVPALASALTQLAVKGITPNIKKDVNEWLNKAECPDCKPAEEILEEIENENTDTENEEVVEENIEEVKEDVDEETTEETSKEVTEEIAEETEEIVEETKEIKEKSPACRQDDETKEECIARKIPEILEENPEMEKDQATAMAISMCNTKCSDKSKEKAETIIVDLNEGEHLGEYYCGCTDVMCTEEGYSKKKCEDIDCKCGNKMRTIGFGGPAKEMSTQLFEQLANLENEIKQVKEGKVLSGKNRILVNEAISSMDNAASALKDLLNESDSSRGGDGKPKGRKEVARKSDKKEVLVRALQKISKTTNNYLRDIKSL